LKEKLERVPAGKFIILRVDWRVPIREFVEEMCRLKFEPGRGFYQFTKTELIRENTRVVLRDKRTGEMFSGDEARRMIGLPPGERARVKPPRLDQYDIFVQSASLNRNLGEETRLLYEVIPNKMLRSN